LKEWFNPHHPDRLMTTHVIRRHNGFLQQLRTMIFNKTHREKNPNLLWLMSLRESNEQQMIVHPQMVESVEPL
jgi:hypothetical protein